jgi:restriction system protein
MSPISNKQKQPEAVAYIPRVVMALRALGGSAKVGAVKEAIVASMMASGSTINEVMLSSGVPKYDNDIRWARMYLVNAGYLEPTSVAGYSNWQLTLLGASEPLNPEKAVQIYNLTAKKSKGANAESEAAPAEEDPQRSLPGFSTWKSQVKKILTKMPHKGFEWLCASVMTKNGLHATTVTGQSGDKGIDGMGLLKIDAMSLISIRVAW